MSILIDVMGGTQSPGAALRAASSLSLQRDLELNLIGDEATITRHLSRIPHDPARLTVHHAPAAEGQSPQEASVRAATKLMHGKTSQVLVTAGEPHAVTRAAAAHLDLLPGAEQAALCAVYPTARRRGKHADPFVLLLDVGVSFEADASTLVSYARMGAAYAARVSRNPKPRVALLSSSLGGQRGPEEVLEALETLKVVSGLDCIGTINGLEITHGAADVIVCSGLVGKTVIDLLEGVGQVVNQLAHSTQSQSIKHRLAMQVVSENIHSLSTITDWKSYGGAPLLGYEHPIVLTSPGANEEIFERAIKLAAKTIRADIAGAVKEGLK